ncbi:MAG: hypothetical protein H0X62_08020 [Bacteroidetes bacterium]|nr:hypothetical protein [Bacteroidota bacterium]
MEFLIALTYAVFFIFLIYRLKFFRAEGISALSISVIFFLKLCFGAGLYLVYTFYYPERAFADIFKYYDDATVLFNVIRENPVHFLQILTGINADAEYLMVYYENTSHWYKPYDYGIYNDNRTIIRSILLFYPLSFGYYAPQIVFFCFISLIGLLGIFKAAYPYMKERAVELAFAVFLLPSLLFWSSGILKESILLFGFGIFIYYLFKVLFVKLKFRYLLRMAFCFLLLALVKGYVMLALIPALLSLLVIKISGNRFSGLKFLFTHILILVVAVNLYRINPELDALYYLHQKQQDFINVGEEVPAGSYIKTKIFEPKWTSLITNAPEAISTVLFRPTVFEANSAMMALAALENFLILLICAILLYNFKIPDKKSLPLLWFSIFFTLSLAAIIGFVTPVLGAVVRYKIPLMPFLIIIFILISNKEMMVKRLPFLKFLNKAI